MVQPQPGAREARRPGAPVGVLHGVEPLRRDGSGAHARHREAREERQCPERIWCMWKGTGLGIEMVSGRLRFAYSEATVNRDGTAQQGAGWSWVRMGASGELAKMPRLVRATGEVVTASGATAE